MAISTYAELLTAIDNFIDDSLTDRRAEFITLAEGKLNRKLRGIQQRTLATATYGTAATNRAIALPAGFIEMIDLVSKKATENDTEYTALNYIPPERLVEYYTTSGEPQFFTVRNQIEFERDADQDYTLRMHYIKGLDIATDLTNWVLTDYPDAYLYGALVEASVFNNEESRAPMFKSMFEEAIQDINDLDDRLQDDGEMDVSDLAAMSYGRSGYNIETDR